MAELLEKSLFNALSCLEQVDKDQMWVDTHTKVIKLAKAISLALEQVDDDVMAYDGYMISIYNAKKTLTEVCEKWQEP